MSTRRPTLSLVVPAYNEAESLPALVARLREVLGTELDWEVLICDDGSTDATFDVVQRLHAEDPRVRGIHLLLNGGHMKALVAGLDHAEGDLVVTMDADLQHPPEVIPEIIRRWRGGALVVHTIRQETAHESIAKRILVAPLLPALQRAHGDPHPARHGRLPGHRSPRGAPDP